MLHHVEGNNLP